MLLFKCITVILINFFIKTIRSEEIINSSTEQISTTAGLLTENVANSLNLEISSTTSNSPPVSPTIPNDLISTTLDNLDISSLASKANDLKDKETTPSWELIYPEQNSTTPETSAKSSSALLPSLVPTTEAAVKNLPKYFKVDDVTNCQKYFGQCLKQVLSNIVPKLKNGSSSPRLPPLDPIYFNSTAFQYNSNPFTGYITIRYALIYGLTSIQFKKIDFFPLENNKFKARFSMVIPKMSAIGAYKGDVHVNNIRARPKGEFNVTMNGLGVEMVTLGVILRKDEHTFLKLTKNNATTTLKDSKINATGIFPDQRLNDIVVNVANQYWRDLFSIVLPETRSNWLPILTDTLNAALAMVPFDFLK